MLLTSYTERVLIGTIGTREMVMKARHALNDHVIRVVAETLSDGSEVFNVHFGNIVLHAVTDRDAVALSNRLFEAIDLHTVDAVAVSYE